MEKRRGGLSIVVLPEEGGESRRFRLSPRGVRVAKWGGGAALAVAADGAVDQPQPGADSPGFAIHAPNLRRAAAAWRAASHTTQLLRAARLEPRSNRVSSQPPLNLSY